ncbi:uncharacterized protein IWZ02DRAFT_463236 [Phyllosticta citriasiana]|uniref:uncharacterized protein n=1 Tax=Phyllosticta citriasiana TaxID=595635 RepID=UPI0030FDE0B0
MTFPVLLKIWSLFFSILFFFSLLLFPLAFVPSLHSCNANASPRPARHSRQGWNVVSSSKLRKKIEHASAVDLIGRVSAKNVLAGTRSASPHAGTQWRCCTPKRIR